MKDKNLITIETNERELQALTVLIDAAVKALGIRGAGDAVGWVMKIEAALKEAKPVVNGKGHDAEMRLS